MATVVERWREFRKSAHDKIMNGLTFDYSGDVQFPLQSAAKARLREEIVEALSIWEFIISDDTFIFASDSSHEVTWSMRRNYLNELRGSYAASVDKKLIETLLRLESLPTPIFRQILWSLNIDFMSKESFLRRLDAMQIEGIKEACHEFWNQKADDDWNQNTMPTGCKQRWFNKRMTRQLALNSGFEAGKRYVNVAAMSYNLLNLDFGFLAYPDGTESDRKVTEVSPWKFLSNRDHQSVSVNKEYGLYFWLYRTCRSNYVYRSEKEVQLKPHICPGFWLTIILQLIFWVVSPTFFLVDGLNGSYTGSYLSHIGFLGIVSVLISAVTPLWFIAAFLKYLVVSIGDLLVKLAKNHKQGAKICLGGFLYSLEALLVKVAYDDFSRLVNRYWAALVMMWFLLLLVRLFVYFVEGSKVVSWKYDGIKKGLRISFYILAAVTNIVLVAAHFQIIWTWLAKAAYDIFIWCLNFVSLIVNFFEAAGLISLILALPFLTSVGIKYLNRLIERNSEKQKTFLRIMGRVMPAMYLALLGIAFLKFLGLAIEADLDGFQLSTPGMIIMGSVLIIIFIQWVIIKGKAPVYQERREMVKKLKPDNFLERWLVRQAIKRNEYLNSLPVKQRLPELTEALSAFPTIFCLNSRIDKDYAYREWVANFNPSSLKKVKESCSQIYRLRPNDLQVETFFRMIYGMGFDQAVKEAEAYLKAEDEAKESRDAKRDARLEVVIKVAYVIFFPLVLIYKFIMKLWEWGKTLYFLVELFNKLCPYVVEEKRIDEDESKHKDSWRRNSGYENSIYRDSEGKL